MNAGQWNYCTEQFAQRRISSNLSCVVSTELEKGLAKGHTVSIRAGLGALFSDPSDSLWSSESHMTNACRGSTESVEHPAAGRSLPGHACSLDVQKLPVLGQLPGVSRDLPLTWSCPGPGNCHKPILHFLVC